MSNGQRLNSTEAGRLSETAGMALLWICLLAPTAGFIDIIASMIRPTLASEYESLYTVSVPLAVTTLVFALAFALVWLLFVLFFRERGGVYRVPGFISATLAIALVFTMACVVGMIMSSSGPKGLYKGVYLYRTAALCGLTVLLFLATYPSGVGIVNNVRRQRSPMLLILAAPFVLAWTLLAICLRKYNPEVPLVSMWGLATGAAYVLAVILTLTFFYRAGHKRLAGAAAVIPLLLALSAPAITFFLVVPEEEREAGTPVEGKPRLVLLITVDALRADVLSCFGSTVVSTPHVDSLASDGTLFSNAISASPWTLPSVASLMTGVSPLVHETTVWNRHLPDRFQTLAEYFHDAGYRTVAMGENPALNAVHRIDQGFGEYTWYAFEGRMPVSFGKIIVDLIHSTGVKTVTERLTDLALERLGIAKQSSLFLWIHYYDPHMPYTPPKEFSSEARHADAFGLKFSEFDSVRMGRIGDVAEEREWVRSLYECEVRFVDSEIGRLLDAVKEMGLYDGAAIVLTSDHGEEFWDHGGFEHGHSMYRELLNVPLIIKFPESKTTGKVESLVGTEGLAPTILELAGLPFDPASVTSPSFLSFATGEAPAGGVGSVVSTSMLYFQELEAVTTPAFKYIGTLDGSPQEIFDLAQDPLEQFPLDVRGQQQIVGEAHQLLEVEKGLAGETRFTAGASQGEEVHMDAGTEESLRALGYID